LSNEQNFLPTKSRLQDRGVNVPLNCVLCDGGLEDNFICCSCV